MKNKIIAAGAGLVALAVSVALIGIVVSDTAQIAGKYGLAAAVLTAGSMGLFMLGLITPKQ